MAAKKIPAATTMSVNDHSLVRAVTAAGARVKFDRYTGEITSTNIIAASIDAYVDAINALLGEEHWQDATEAAGNRKRAGLAGNARERRAELDEDAGRIDTTDWFNQ